ncbi:Uncharacterised protein [Mycobacteroides abscessus subsp. abscessus]|nr:Uncharacterised protein [Mycobacteroides abscessus subsp. abscessus]
MLQNLGADLENKYTGRRDQWSQRCPKQGGTLKPAVRCVAFVAQSQYRSGKYLVRLPYSAGKNCR